MTDNLLSSSYTLTSKVRPVAYPEQALTEMDAVVLCPPAAPRSPQSSACLFSQVFLWCTIRPAIKSHISRSYESKWTKRRAKDFQASNDSCKTKRSKTNDSIVLAAKKKKIASF